MAKLRHIFVDLDGVLADFMRGALALHQRDELLGNWPAGEWDMPKVLGISSGKFWGAITKRGAGFWEALDVYPWTFEMIERLRDIAPITIATSPSLDPGCLDGKMRWIAAASGPVVSRLPHRPVKAPAGPSGRRADRRPRQQHRSLPQARRPGCPLSAAVEFQSRD